MRDMVDAQTQQSNVYLDQLQKQFIRIEKEIENGKTVTINLTDNGLVLSLTVSRDQVIENEAPIHASKTGESRSLDDNESLVSLVTNTFAFDLGEANRKISPADIQAEMTKANKEKSDGDNERQIASASGLQSPLIGRNGKDYFLGEDYTFATYTGLTITGKKGFKTDLASVPRIFWTFISPVDLSFAGPIFHDMIYRSGGKISLPDGEVSPPDKVFTREETDDLFLELMTRSEIGFWKRSLAYLAVKKFGKSSWQKRPIS